MATKNPYLPSREGDLKTWLSNMKAKINAHGATIGLSIAEINAIVVICNRLIAEIDGVEQIKNDLQEAVQKKNNFKSADLKELGRLITRAKTHTGYTNDIGEDLDVVGEDKTIDVATSKPGLTAKKVPNGTEISFNLLDFFEGVNIYRKRPADAGFTFLAMDTSSPYVDTDPQVSGTQYHAFYINNKDEEVGQKSDVLTVEV